MRYAIERYRPACDWCGQIGKWASQWRGAENFERREGDGAVEVGDEIERGNLEGGISSITL